MTGAAILLPPLGLPNPRRLLVTPLAGSGLAEKHAFKKNDYARSGRYAHNGDIITARPTAGISRTERVRSPI
jgi:hypothetical protein